jgi:predicted membrane channel-forming protein YqfA (hemolysin III family)
MLKAEKVGVSLSVLCAIHCAALPIMLTAFPLLGAGVAQNHFMETVLVVGSLVIASYTLVKDFIQHRKLTAILFCITGFITILLSHHLPETLKAAESWLALTGGIVVAASYVVNWKHRKTCKIKSSEV